ncbi:MAG: amylo-alpha-1,6-glucosidase [Thermomicrobiales bacterium]
MGMEVRVGPSVVTINQSSTFLVTREDGTIEAGGELGLFAQDTRFVSHYEMGINRSPWTLLNGGAISYSAARWYYTSPEVETEADTLPARAIGMCIEREIGHGVCEDVTITNYSLTPVAFQFEIIIRSDFADIFDVRARKLVDRGIIRSHWDDRRCALLNTYHHDDFHRRFLYRLHDTTSEPRFSNGRILFDVVLAPQASWHAQADHVPILGADVHDPVNDLEQPVGISAHMRAMQERWKSVTANCASDNVHFNHSFDQSIDDMGALRIYDHDYSEDAWIPAAGVPWYVTIFGRDSLIASLQTMMIHHPFALGSLQRLAEHQATTVDDWRDAEPGKIPHEIRFGELAHFHKIPHTPYYGTADATPLYLITLHEAYLWTGNAGLLDRYRDVAERCLEWIDRYGDLDGDGFQEYQTRSLLGYHNMAWKDAGNAVVWPDGTQVALPIGTCELQGYIYDAKQRMAEVYTVLGENTRAEQLRAEAEALKRRFNEVFWVEEEGTYGFALGGPEKRLVRTVASNAGHCLWSGIVPPDRADRVIARLLAPDMFSGWGIRTLSDLNPAFNPFDYQLGSVWPHDNAIIAAGMQRYGNTAGLHRVAKAILDAQSGFDRYRLPELFAGLQRDETSFPVQYLGANIPQAWAAGAIFMLLRALLGIAADAPHNRLVVAPTLPDWLPRLDLSNLRIGDARLHLRFWREGDVSRWELVEQHGEQTIEIVDGHTAAG